ncbi:Voltage-dependent calcium channel [Trichinella pseudospiralis]
MDIRPLNNDESGRTVTPFEAGCRQGETELRDGTVLEKRKSQADLEISLSPEERKSAMEEWLKFNRSIREIRVRAKRASGTRQSVRNENPAAGTSDSEWAARLLRRDHLPKPVRIKRSLIWRSETARTGATAQ